MVLPILPGSKVPGLHRVVGGSYFCIGCLELNCASLSSSHMIGPEMEAQPKAASHRLASGLRGGLLQDAVQ